MRTFAQQFLSFVIVGSILIAMGIVGGIEGVY